MVSTIDQASAAIGGTTETPTSFMQITDSKGQARGECEREKENDSSPGERKRMMATLTLRKKEKRMMRSAT